MKLCSKKSYIAGMGSYLPKTIVSSQTLMEEVGAKRFGLHSLYIDKMVGIKERRIADEKSQPSDLATIAAQRALEDAGISASEIDAIVYSAIATDNEEPSTAHTIQHNLAAENAVVWDVSNACLGFFNGLLTADALIGSGMAQTVLVCTGEKSSDVLYEFLRQLKNTNDKLEFRRKVGALTLGDAGGAMIIKRNLGNECGWQWGEFTSSGQHRDLCKYKITTQGMEGQMLMNEICNEGVAMHARAIERSLQGLGWSGENIDKLYCHQVGAVPLKRLADLAGVDMERVPITYEKLGNLASATIPVLMDLNRPAPGDKIFFMGSGSGLSIFQGGMQI